MNKIPNFFIVGASKCATTSMYNLLAAQKSCCLSSVKEPFFFNDSQKNKEWYFSLFEGCERCAAVGEATPIYSETTYFPEVPKKIYDFNNDSKIIYVVRNPYERMKSVWKQALSSGHFFQKKYYNRRMPLNFEKAIFEYPPFLEACKYWTHIQNYRKYFADSKIRIIYFEDFISDISGVMNEVNNFLGLGPFQQSALDSVQKNSSKGKVVFNPVTHLLSKVPGCKQLIGVIPKDIKWNLKQKVSMPVPHDPRISEGSKDKIRKALNEELRLLFEYTGKPADYWIL
jgi:hypothetical protein